MLRRFGLGGALALAGVLVAVVASAVSYRVEFQSNLSPAEIVRVGVMVDGTPLTSGTPRVLRAGVYELDTHVFFGRDMSLVLFHVDGRQSAPSNMQVYDGCVWDIAPLGGDGVVAGPDLGEYLRQIVSDTASVGEFASFRSAFGSRCP